MELLEITGVVASFLGIVMILSLSKKEIDGWIKGAGLPRDVNFYVWYFYALLAAFLGGLLWSILNRVFGFMDPTLGGPTEPHGAAVIVWAIATNVPVIITLIILNRIYRFIAIRKQVLLYIVFLLSQIAGALLFYDFPLSRNVGFRNYFNTQPIPFFQKELLLVVIWSALLSIPAFLAIGLVRVMLDPAPVRYRAIVWTFLNQIGQCIGLTTLAVVLFLLAFPADPQFETARGIIAGVALRMSLFLGLLIGQKMKLPRMDLQ